MKTLIFLSLFAAGNIAMGEAVPGKPAPVFETAAADGKLHKLSDFSGKWIVMEWYNKDCPYVKKHYGSNNMQDLQKKYTSKGVIWLSVNSSAEGKEGYTDAKEAMTVAKAAKSNATAILLDPTGVVGKAYGSKTTPHMFVIDPKGTVVYAGAIDDNNSSDPKVIAKSKNYVAAALDAGLENKKIETTSTKPYGCGTKYAN